MKNNEVHGVQQPKKAYTKYAIASGVLVVACVTSFFGGMQVQKNAASSATANNGASRFNQTGAMGGNTSGRRRMGVPEAVTAVSSTSITVNDQRQNKAVTYSVTADTTVTNSGASAAIGDVKVGDQVVVVPSASDATIAGRIILGGANANNYSAPTQTN